VNPALKKSTTNPGQSSTLPLCGSLQEWEVPDMSRGGVGLLQLRRYKRKHALLMY
jgi:hypothetical protein